MNSTAKARPIVSSRMSLAGVRKGRLQSPLRIFLYGVEGVGKSTFASGAPSPIFIGAEGGTGHLDIARMAEPQTWSELLEGVRLLDREEHEYRTLVLDPVNWLEALAYAHLCEKNGWSSIEEPGFGKGQSAAVDLWRELVVDLERLWSHKAMHVILVGHSMVKTFKNPEGEDFDRYQPSMNEKSSGVLKQWCDVVMFAKHELVAKRDVKTKRVRGAATGMRMLYTAWSAAYDAKNRHNLPPEIPLSWRAFDDALKAGTEHVRAARARIEAILAEIDDAAATAKAAAWLVEAGDDLAKIAEIENAATTKLEEMRAQRETTTPAKAS